MDPRPSRGVHSTGDYADRWHSWSILPGETVFLFLIFSQSNLDWSLHYVHTEIRQLNHPYCRILVSVNIWTSYRCQFVNWNIRRKHYIPICMKKRNDATQNRITLLTANQILRIWSDFKMDEQTPLRVTSVTNFRVEKLLKMSTVDWKKIFPLKPRWQQPDYR